MSRLSPSPTWLLPVAAALLALVPATASAQAPQPGELVINELMVNPESVFDDKGEYIEIYNNSSRSLNFYNCQIRDSSGAVWRYALNYTISPHTYLVLGINDDYATNGGVVLNIEYTGVRMHEPTGFVQLEYYQASSPIVLDRVEWDFNGPDWSNTPGCSLALADPSLDNNDGRYWSDSTTLINGAGSDYGTPGEINEVTQNSVPEVNLNSSLGTLSGTALVDYQIRDDEGDTCFVVVEFSTDAGVTWDECTQGTGGDGTTGIATTSTYQTRTFAWDTWADLLGVSALETVQFRIVPWDYKPGQTTPVMVEVDVDNSANQRPTVTVNGTSGTYGVITVNYSLNDPDGDPCTLIPEFSTNGGTTWYPATEAQGLGDGTTGIGNGTHAFAWNSLANAVGDTGDETVRVRLTPTDIPSAPTLTGTADSTSDFTVNNEAGIVRPNDVVISEILATPQHSGDPAGEWFELTNTLRRDVQLCGWCFEDASGGVFTIGTSLLLPDRGRVVIGYTTSNAQNGNADVDIAYGTTLSLAADGALTARIGRAIDSVDWDDGATYPYAVGQSIERDNPAAAAADPASWMLSPSVWPGSTGDYGTPGTAPTATGSAPTVTVTSLPRLDGTSTLIVYSDTILATFTPQDADGDRVTAFWEYSLNGGGTWSAATLSPFCGAMNGLDSGTSHTFAWDSIADGVGTSTPADAVRLRVTVSDSKPGTTATMAEDIHVDNRPNDPPVVAITGLDDGTGTPPFSGPLFVTYTVSDDEDDAAFITVEYSTDGGTTWNTCTESVPGSDGTGPLATAGSPTYTYVWHSAVDNVGRLGAVAVVLRITPRDQAHAWGGTPVTTTTEVENLAAPTATISVSSNYLVNNAVFVSGTQSYGSVATYDWDFGNGQTATGETASTVYTSTGTYTITLTVDGPMGSDTATVKVSITESSSTLWGGGSGCGAIGNPTSPAWPFLGWGLLLGILLLWRRRFGVR